MLNPATTAEPRLRLRPTVEAFPASDGNLYLLRGGATADFVIRDPAPEALSLIRRLASGWSSTSALADGLAREGHGRDAAVVAGALADLSGAGLLEHERVDDRLSPAEAERYDRQLAYFADFETAGIDRFEAQHRLAEATVLIVGVGGLGSWTAAALACAGVGRLVLVDGDAVSLSNLNRQLLFREADVGRSKVGAAADALERFDSELTVETHCRYLDGPEDAAERVRGANAVVATADHPPYLINRWIDEACCRLGVPWICAGQFPPLLRVGPLYIPGMTGCLECQEQHGREQYPLYDELAEWRQQHPTLAATTGFGSGFIGSVIAGELVHLLTGTVRPATSGRAITIDMRSLRTTWEPEVARRHDCPRCGEARRS